VRYRITNRGKIVVGFIVVILILAFFMALRKISIAPKDSVENANIKNEIQIQEEKSAFIENQKEQLKNMEEKIKEREQQLNEGKIDVQKLNDEISKINAEKNDLEDLLMPQMLTIFFEPNKADIDSVYFESLEQLSRILNSISYDKITVEGNVYSVRKDGPTQFANELAQTRADSVADYLIEQGIESRKIEIINNLNDKPFLENSKYREFGAFNRRVDIVVKK